MRSLLSTNRRNCWSSLGAINTSPVLDVNFLILSPDVRTESGPVAEALRELGANADELSIFRIISAEEIPDVEDDSEFD